MTIRVPALPMGSDSAFFLDLYARYQRNPASVPADWRIHFESLDGAPAGDGSSNAAAAEQLAKRLTDGFRLHGHREARLDPLGLQERKPVSQLDALRREVLMLGTQEAEVRLGRSPRGMSLAAFADALESIYCGTIALEAEHVLDDDGRQWLYEAYEASAAHQSETDVMLRAMNAIARADTFETFAQVKFPTKKRFGIEGAETAFVFLTEALHAAAHADVSQVVMGGMHRGRMTMLATLLAKPVAQVLAEMKGRDLSGQSGGDVPYHLGHCAELMFDGRPIKVMLLPHPSHLITVAPVATGFARGTQVEDKSALCLLLHTDAAFAGQGLAAELLQLGGLAGYSVGGTIHLVVNNQIGFTTTPSEGRSSPYCTDFGKAVGAPVIHVNGDDPLAVARAGRIAVGFRQRFGRDILIDLVCFRRHGHNELDEPRFTGPSMYRAIEALPSIRSRFEKVVVAAAPQSVEAVNTGMQAFKQQQLQQAYEQADSFMPNAGAQLQTNGIVDANEADLLEPVDTGVACDQLLALTRALCEQPANTRWHAKVEQFYRARLETVEARKGINFATAEALAFATLLSEGTSVRLSGQDSVRGTFTQRHLAMHDTETGAGALAHAGLASEHCRFEAINSPLSEYAVLAFEYGYSLARTGDLVMWEAQFGDFLNGAQIAVDQFIVSAEAKWQLRSGLVVLLPHGLEGQGPDHSSARVERILQLCAGGNIIVAHPSTPANLFHLLRRQVKAPWRKPLFVLSPKSLLRQRACASSLDEMDLGTRFQPVIGDNAAAEKGWARRVVLCTGKVYYDLLAARDAAGLNDEVALVRVEQLYPLAAAQLKDALAPFGDAPLIWCQEEPANQGALEYIRRAFDDGRIETAASQKIRYVARPAASAPAGGSIERHEAEQRKLIAEALGLTTV